MENILKCKHLFISRVRIEVMFPYGELSLTRDVVGQMRLLIHSGCAFCPPTSRVNHDNSPQSKIIT